MSLELLSPSCFTAMMLRRRMVSGADFRNSLNSFSLLRRDERNLLRRIALMGRKNILIIMDLVMPNMNGLEAALVIHSLMPEARIVVFRLYAGDFGKAILHAAGVDVLVEKVEGATGLMNALQNILPDSSDVI